MMLQKRLLYLFVLILLALEVKVYAQENPVYIDKEGILRLNGSNEEAAFFGVNYAAPFAHAYRSLKKLDIDIKAAIDADVTHLARLELNAYRIHVWDREVSDREGNLLNNEHMELFDYLLHKLKEKGIKIILTPIAWWGTGWPEPDLDTPGFSTFYSKVQMITEPEARKAQANYLRQFLNHVNKYDDVAYKNDTSIVAFEIINEPHHPRDTSITSSYIKEMAAVIRAEGVTKPIYYNISENWSKEEAEVVYNSDIDGISFQWYPTGLVKRSELMGNFLSHVDHYPIPDIKERNFRTKSRMVYEFDAADKSGSYMYPAMARSFKEAGMQWATMFCYDPMYMAPYNTEYQTHYLNLVYTPQKAISFLIASNIFKEVKAYSRFNSAPDNLEFGNFKISYKGNLSEMDSGTRFYYSNNTLSSPKDISKLEHIAGYGSSQVVKTNSKGAYFLDKISNGIWRLEIYPDAVWLKDPFGANSLKDKSADIYFNESIMEISLPDLGKTFYSFDINNNNSISAAVNGSISLNPGVYVLSVKKEMDKNLTFNFNGIGLRDFYIPPKMKKESYVLHSPRKMVFEDDSLIINAEVFSEDKVKGIQLYFRKQGWGNFTKEEFIKTGKYLYTAVIPASIIKNVILEYCIAVSAEENITFPGTVKGTPGEWDFSPKELWQVKIFPRETPYMLFNPANDYQNIILPGIWQKVEYSAEVINDSDNNSFYEIRFNKIKRPLDDFTLQIELDNLLTDLSNSQLESFNGLSVELYCDEGIDSVYFTYVTDDLQSLSTLLKGGDKIKKIFLSNFEPGKFVLLPSPYPQFLPYYFTPSEGEDKITKMKPGYFQITVPMKGFDQSMNGTCIRIGKIELIKSPGTISGNE